MTNIVLVELNELNFDLISKYIESGAKLPNFQRLLEYQIVTSTSEKKYQELEPWIQWPSIHTGKSFEEHKVFRLGDIVNYGGEQIFEVLENEGYKIGCFCSMNVENRVRTPGFFIPDPWTNTKPDRSLLSRLLHGALVQAVNDNAKSKIKLISVLKLLIVTICLVRPTNYLWFFKKFRWALGKKWRKAIFLDVMLTEYFTSLLMQRPVHFSTVFLNAAAHIQHRFMLSSTVLQSNRRKNPEWYIENGADPLLEVYEVYDELIARIIKNKNYKYVFATGLSQAAYENPVFYYRLSNHKTFLGTLGIRYFYVEPRMTRDFLIGFSGDEDRDRAFDILNSCKVNDLPLFGVIEKRSSELFVTLDYAQEIDKSSKMYFMSSSEKVINLYEHVNFVAIKNGEHQEKGFVAIDPGLTDFKFQDGNNVRQLFFAILDKYKKSERIADRT